jgi:RNA polymerase sigma factor (sigma-70 family)
VSIDRPLVARLYGRAAAARWGVTIDQFHAALEVSAAHAFPDGPPASPRLRDYLSSLHVEDLALAIACAAGRDDAWDHFIREHRPGLYRAAEVIDRTGGGRELADSLYADLFGLRERDGVRQSLFRYFHGRSALGTWVRAILAQRHVDRVRIGRRLEPLPEEDAPDALSSPAVATVPDPARPIRTSLVIAALKDATGQLDTRDRLRLGGYYVQRMTLAAIGRLMGEHEGSVSRHLTRIRGIVRDRVETTLRGRGLDEAAIDEAIRVVIEDPGTMDVAEVVGAVPTSKNVRENRSKDGDE